MIVTMQSFCATMRACFLFLLFGLRCYIEGAVLNKTHDVQYAKVGSKICMRNLGCFEITDDFFHWTRRPINLLPKDRAIINTKFFLFTNTNPRDRHILDADHKETLKNSPLNPANPTKFIVHGYIDSELFGPWQDKLKDELLLKGPTNVIIVDWSGGNMLPYTQATANTRIVGAEIAFLVKALEESLGASRSDVHIIGHSLGSHIAGYAGERLPGLGRITGLDPAEPYFQGLPPSVRLDETDADFVDAIHTDSKSILLMGLGMSQLVGHIDFFPNNGQNQPGCTTSKFTSIITDGLVEGGRRFAACNHQRSVDFFTASINRGSCVPVAYSCSSWEDFLEGKCSECGPNMDHCAIMGLRAYEFKDANPVNLKVYVKTSGRQPFCLYHYQVKIQLHKPSGSKDVSGTLEITIGGDMGETTTKLTKDSVDLYAGSQYTYLVTTEKNMGKINHASLVWIDSSSSLNPLNWIKKAKIYVKFIQVLPMNVVDKEQRKSETKRLCLHDINKPVPSKKLTVFIPGNC